MCGRFCLMADADTVIGAFNLRHNVILSPRYNIAPGQVIPVIRNLGNLEFIEWGFKPTWLKEGQAAFVNARSETLLEKPAFKQAITKQRCVIVASGYYEWKQIGKHKQPFYITLKNNRLLTFAGIYHNDTCAIITTQATGEASKIKERMPQIIHPKLYTKWLDPKVKYESIYTDILSTEYDFDICAVSTKVNNPKNDFIECIKALN